MPGDSTDPNQMFCETSAIINGTVLQPSCGVYLGTLMDFCHPTLDLTQRSQPRSPPLVPGVVVSSSRLQVPLSHFLILDLPKIALTGDINGLLLASS